ncbi:MAG: sodium/glutamate symporter [Succinivibrionaceae bacterium]
MSQHSVFEFHFDMVSTLGLAAVLLIVGIYIKKFIPVLKKFFIPAPIVGGIVFSVLTLIGHKANLFNFTYDDVLKNLFMTAFFTSVGFLASFRLLLQGGISVVLFLVLAIALLVIQNIIGVSFSGLFGLDPLQGLAIGSISLSGGHGTSAAFAPLLEDLGIKSAMSVSIAAATFGLVAGSLIGGPVGRMLLMRHKLKPDANETDNTAITEGKLTQEEKTVSTRILFAACCCLIISMSLGDCLISILKNRGIILPPYLGPMVIAAVIRNIADLTNRSVPVHAIDMAGGIALQFFLAMALMTMKLWQLEELAIPLITVLLVQMLVTAAFAYFVTFRIMGRNYDAAVIACGHCGFALGATPNAMANIQTFTLANGPSPKAFFVIPMVGSLFIDFFNAFVITSFIKFFS